MANTQAEIISLGSNFKNRPLKAYVEKYIDTVKNSERGVGTTRKLLEDVSIYRDQTVQQSLKDFFIEDVVDRNLVSLGDGDYNSILEGYNQLFDNDIKKITESTMVDYAPVIGMTLPVHKLIMMNMVWGKAIENMVATQPSFSVTMEHRYLVTPEGEEIDIALEQNKISQALNNQAKARQFRVKIADVAKTDFITQLGGTVKDKLSISTAITAVCIENAQFENGDKLPDANGFISEASETHSGGKTTKELWVRCNIPFNATTGRDFTRSATAKVVFPYVKLDKSGTATPHTDLTDIITAVMENNKITSFSNGIVTKVEISTKLDSSLATMDFCSVKWRPYTDVIHIDDGKPISTTISPQEAKDINAFYDVDQMTKYMAMYKDILSEDKDMTVKQTITVNSWETMPERAKVTDTFDFWTPAGNTYALTPVEYRHQMFAEQIDSVATRMIQVLNDPNVVLNILGDPDSIRRVTPTQRVYEAPASIGAVNLDYTQTIVNVTDRRIIQLFGSDKLRGHDEFHLILNPRNTDRFIYRLFDYQLYVGTEIRNPGNTALPAVTAFDRYAVREYQPVQGRLKLLNQYKFH